FKSLLLKELGNSDAIVHVSMLSCRLLKHISVSGRKNSLIACRQVPQGGTGLSVSATTTIFLKDISPAAIAENKATRSAQHVTGYAAFSMLHPTNTFPVDVNSAAPTANLEYGM